MVWADLWWQILVFILCSYLFGNINFAVIISKFHKQDVRDKGSGNPGTMNMYRNFGAKLAALTLILDVLKGCIPALLGLLIYRKVVIDDFVVGDLMAFIAGVSAILGHVYPVLMKFKGGKGVATTIGLFLAVSPLWAIGMFVFLLLFILIFEYGSMGSFIFIMGMCIQMGVKYYIKYCMGGYPHCDIAPYLAVNILLFFISLLTCWAHRRNIFRLCQGTEHRTSLKGLFKKRKKKAEIENQG